jgi:hypothetical protein
MSKYNITSGVKMNEENPDTFGYLLKRKELIFQKAQV